MKSCRARKSSLSASLNKMSRLAKVLLLSRTNWRRSAMPKRNLSMRYGSLTKISKKLRKRANS